MMVCSRAGAEVESRKQIILHRFVKKMRIINQCNNLGVINQYLDSQLQVHSFHPVHATRALLAIITLQSLFLSIRSNLQGLDYKPRAFVSLDIRANLSNNVISEVSWLFAQAMMGFLLSELTLTLTNTAHNAFPLLVTLPIVAGSP